MLTYSPKIFSVPDEKAAMRIILTPDGRSTEDRWAVETQATVALAAPFLPLGPNDVMLDYGCGIGRLSKAFIERFGCRVIGVDISPEMRRLAHDYVASPLFSIFSREAFLGQVRAGLRVSGAVCVWVLQHCQNPAVDLSVIRDALRPEARLFVINNTFRAVPTVERVWANDGRDVKALLAETLAVVAEGGFTETDVGPVLASNTFWGAYELPGASPPVSN